MRWTRPERRSRAWARTGAVVALVGALVSGCGGSGSSSAPSGSPSPGSSSSASTTGSPAERFLQSYVTSDGRVLRRDQGDDVVSEGQAYGMLAAQLAGRDQLAATIWSWTRQHLQQPDGLLAYHADQNGTILDHQPAADADTLAAYALLRATGAGSPSLHQQGLHLASAVLAHETARDQNGDLVLVAGPWAVARKVVDPSYWMPSIFEGLARLTGDHRWAGLATTSVSLVDRLTGGGRTLPPDWARLEGDRAVATGQGGGGGTPQYGADAQRVPLWFAASCDAHARQLASSWWSVLQQDSRSNALTLSTTGDVLDASASPVALLASSAAASAAGDTGGAQQLRTGAAQADSGTPTYYGAAWLALADGLRTGRLGGCGTS